jgi:hypothetical protein
MDLAWSVQQILLPLQDEFMTQTNPMPGPGEGPRESEDPFTTGDEMLERAKKVARDITEKVRKLTDDTKTGTARTDDSTDPDATEEMPPVN